MARPRIDLETRFWLKVNKDGPIPSHMPHLGQCWLWTGRPHGGGYGRISVGRSTHYQAHVASWVIHSGPPPIGMNVLHKCDVRMCVRPDHLWLGTLGDNNRDCVSKGRQPGNLGKGKVLTPEIVLRMRSLYRPRTFGRTKLARLFHISQGCVQKVLNREIWDWVVDPGQSQPGST